MVKKVIINLDLSKASGPDCIQVYSTRAVALDIPKAFDRVWQAGLLHKLKSYGISGQIFGLISSSSVIDGFKCFWIGNVHKNVQLMLEFLKVHSWSYTFPTIH